MLNVIKVSPTKRTPGKVINVSPSVPQMVTHVVAIVQCSMWGQLYLCPDTMRSSVGRLAVWSKVVMWGYTSGAKLCPPWKFSTVMLHVDLTAIMVCQLNCFIRRCSGKCLSSTNTVKQRCQGVRVSSVQFTWVVELFFKLVAYLLYVSLLIVCVWYVYLPECVWKQI